MTTEKNEVLVEENTCADASEPIEGGFTIMDGFAAAGIIGGLCYGVEKVWCGLVKPYVVNPVVKKFKDAKEAKEAQKQNNNSAAVNAPEDNGQR